MDKLVVALDAVIPSLQQLRTLHALSTTLILMCNEQAAPQERRRAISKYEIEVLNFSQPSQPSANHASSSSN